ncbi:hypothetical protein [Nannocystis bainbridge]|uniref:DUF2262 domain-containing protein n=1 Tax=Nannocystis bainbridge TaxID=2995303 RepID=A0ABT5ECL6_9BACT|nr:hypothetical protein [Nannocystis bainbridge]MDC0722521.1 hypothetical protein [Nannocystis bainbridge]
MRPDPDLERRLALAEHIQQQMYPSWASAWLKAVPASAVLEPIHREALLEAGADLQARVAARHKIAQTFLEDHFSLCTPEDAPYCTFVDGSWRAVDRDEAIACADALLATARKRLAELQAEEAAERAEAEAGGWLDDVGPSRLADLMIDLEALRRWFTAELWAAAEPTWFTNTGPGFRGEPAVIALDDDIVTILWLP